jgi:hypothetical protein
MNVKFGGYDEVEGLVVCFGLCFRSLLASVIFV